jgi:hypothetical protein
VLFEAFPEMRFESNIFEALQLNTFVAEAVVVVEPLAFVVAVRLASEPSIVAVVVVVVVAAVDTTAAAAVVVVVVAAVEAVVEESSEMNRLLY